MKGKSIVNANGFREEELVSRRVKVNNQWETRTFPIIGGRLRLAHEQNDNLSLQTELVSWDGQYAVFKCCAVTGKGQFVGYGTSNSQRDTRLAESLIELAETRSIARSLRFAGFGLEFTSAEEVSHVAATESEPEQTRDKDEKPIFEPQEKQDKQETKAPVQPKSENNGNGGSAATHAQVRALFALTRKAKMGEEDIAGMLSPFNVTRFEDLMLPDASRLIQSLQTEVAS